MTGIPRSLYFLVPSPYFTPLVHCKIQSRPRKHPALPSQSFDTLPNYCSPDLLVGIFRGSSSFCIQPIWLDANSRWEMLVIVFYIMAGLNLHNLFHGLPDSGVFNLDEIICKARGDMENENAQVVLMVPLRCIMATSK